MPKYYRFRAFTPTRKPKRNKEKNRKKEVSKYVLLYSTVGGCKSFWSWCRNWQKTSMSKKVHIQEDICINPYSKIYYWTRMFLKDSSWRSYIQSDWSRNISKVKTAKSLSDKKSKSYCSNSECFDGGPTFALYSCIAGRRQSARAGWTLLRWFVRQRHRGTCGAPHGASRRRSWASRANCPPHCALPSTLATGQFSSLKCNIYTIRISAYTRPLSMEYKFQNI